MFQYAAFAFGVLTDINAYYYYTGNSAYLFHALVTAVSTAAYELSPYI